MYQAVLLDMYGTLVHDDDAVLTPICEHIAGLARVEVSVVAEMWWQLFREAGALAHGENFRLQTNMSRETLAETARRLDVDADAHRLCRPQFAFWRQPPVFPDSLPFLQQVGVPVCVVSNIDRDDLDAALAHHGLEVDAVVTSEDAQAYKPRPEPFELALKRLAVTAHDVVHVGDSLTADVAGARSLGIASVWINRSRRPLPAGPAPTFTRHVLTDVLPMLRGGVPPGCGG